MARKPDATARERILAVATRLFDAHGVHTVGLQQIIDELGCGKNLLYREFATKDELVVAYLERCQHDWTSIVERISEELPGDPAGQLIEIVAVVAEQATRPGFRGCPVHNTNAEFAVADHPVHRACVGHFDEVRDHLYDLAVRARADDPRTLADRIALIVDGVNANGAALGARGASSVARGLADDVVRAAL